MQNAKHYNLFLESLNSFIPPKSTNSAGEFGLNRIKALMKLLDNPQDKLKVIHVARTSGKGSTCTIISHLLQKHGFKVGLTVSPHIVDLRERLQINNTFLSKEIIANYYFEILPHIKQLESTEWGKPTFFEVVIALAYYVFWKEKVEYAVIETGLGGWYDGTNVVSSGSKVAVLTKIGLDHTAILGKTLRQIALQKIHIVQPHNHVISNDQDLQVRKVFDQFVETQHGSIEYIKKISSSSLSDAQNFTYKDQWLNLPNLKLGLLGDFQRENATLGLAVLRYLSLRDKFILDEQAIRTILKDVRYLGRFEVRITKNKTVVIDGAHNPQKIKAFIQSLQKMFPDKRYHFLIAFKEDKEYKRMLKYIVKSANSITFTSFADPEQGLQISSISPKVLSESIFDKSITVNAIEDYNQALSYSLSHIKDEHDIVVITGSLYLVSRLYQSKLL